jgi:hypothetical protein
MARKPEPDNDDARFDGENKQTAALAPENENSEQNDEPAQAQSVAEEAINRATGVLGNDTSHVESAFNALDAQDLVDHMKQMERGNTIDMSAFAGEPNHDDEPDTYGKDTTDKD